MRVLLSAYDCLPYTGSESGVGWNWAMQLGLDHDVTVLTREVNREAIERYDQALPAGLRFQYYDNPARERQLARVPYRPYLYYGAWQRDVLPTVRKLHETCRFDVAQHITWGAWRQPSHLHRVGIPLVFGPVGGGETTPSALRKSLDLRRRVEERIRDAANHAYRSLPSLRECLDKSLMIVCRTDDTRAWIPRRHWSKTYVHQEIGVDSSQISATLSPTRGDRKLRVLFIGRFLGWKGIHLGLQAFELFLQRHPGAGEFNLIGGRGNFGNHLEQWVATRGIESAVRFHEWLPHAQVQEFYRSHDVFLFPSFRDSGGTVVLESLAAGLPVVCLDLGGPPNMLRGKGGIVVPARAQSAEEVVKGLAGALETIYASRTLSEQLRREALARAHELTWERTVGTVYEQVEKCLN